MPVYNVHERVLAAGASEVGALIDSLSGRTADRPDLLWPDPQWPAMEFDRPLGVDAVGGHGPVRYTVEAYVPGTWVRFAFSGPRGFDGFHEFTALPLDGGRTALRHTLAMRTGGPARLSWPLAFRWMHDACVEDALDRAEAACTGTVSRPSRWSPYVRLLRSFARREPQAAA